MILSFISIFQIHGPSGSLSFFVFSSILEYPYPGLNLCNRAKSNVNAKLPSAATLYIGISKIRSLLVNTFRIIDTNFPSRKSL